MLHGAWRAVLEPLAVVANTRVWGRMGLVGRRAAGISVNWLSKPRECRRQLGPRLVARRLDARLYRRAPGLLVGGGENQLGLLSPAFSEHLPGGLATPAADLVNVREPEDPSPSAPRAVLDFAGEDRHAELGMRPGAVLRLDHGLGHRRGHRGTALVVVQALGNLADEAVARLLRRGAGDVHLVAVDEDPSEHSGRLVARVNSLALEPHVGAPSQQLALDTGGEGALGDVCVTYRHRVLTSSGSRPDRGACFQPVFP